MKHLKNNISVRFHYSCCRTSLLLKTRLLWLRQKSSFGECQTGVPCTKRQAASVHLSLLVINFFFIRYIKPFTIFMLFTPTRLNFDYVRSFLSFVDPRFVGRHFWLLLTRVRLSLQDAAVWATFKWSKEQVLQFHKDGFVSNVPVLTSEQCCCPKFC